MKEKILQVLKEDKNMAYSIESLIQLLELDSVEKQKELSETLILLEKELRIQVTKKGKYMLFDNPKLKIGTVMANRKGFAFIDIDGDKDIYVTQVNLNGAIHNDRVIVELFQNINNNIADQKIEGKVVSIVSRDMKEMVGEFYTKDGKNYINLDNEKVHLIIEIEGDKTKGAMTGHKVLVKLLEQKEDNYYMGEIIRILGHKNDPGVDILSIAYENGIHDVFPDDVMAELDNIPVEVKEEEFVNRKDLRNEMIFTIDGDDTKDIDDAISYKKLSNGNHELGVHIADVSYYLKEGSPLDKEAYLRGTSSYLADTVIPMIPHKLSNGICSLNPNVDRLAISCVMEIDDNGKTVSADIFESVIKSNIQMTYNKVNQILEKNIIPEGYESYAETLKQMAELAKKLRNHKISKGYIDFEIDEPKIIVDDNGKAIDVTLRVRGTGEKLIEDFMIAANESVAETITYMEYPFVYRVHGEPNEEKMQKFLNFLGIQGIHIKGKFKKLYPKTVQEILKQIKLEVFNKYTDEDAEREFHMIATLLLRSMQKAIYDTNNIGHFGLGSSCYTHFTSPIRRYPDTTVHRLLRKYLFIKQTDQDLRETIEYNKRELPMIAEHSSEMERAAVECEREVDDMKMAEYMLDHIGEEYDGMISSIMNFGMFVELPNLIEGLIRFDDMGDDHYTYFEDTFSLVGRRTKKVYKIGDKVRIKVKSANKDNRTIDFILVTGETDGNKE